MRRLALVVVLCGAFQVLSPVPAQAWFEKIDQLSGPGPFWGWDLQFRFACVQDPNVRVPAAAAQSEALIIHNTILPG